MSRDLKSAVSLIVVVTLIVGSVGAAYGRGGIGGGGRAGGGARMGGAGMARPSPAMSRAPTMSRSPSMSRPAAMPSRPSSMARPSTGARPSFPTTRPSTGLTPGSRPGTVDFARPSTLPSAGRAPGLTPGSRPSLGTPGISQLPAAPRPGIGPGTGISRLPAGQRPGVGTRPSLPGGSTALLPGLGNRPGIDGSRGDRIASRPTTPQERRDNLQERLSTRDINRDDFQNRREDVREDWHDRYENFYDRHDDWHHGCWHGNASDWWHHMWDEHTALMAFGTTMWGLNRLAYGFGYWGYENPYYTEPYPIDGGAPLDYSQPIAYDPAPAEAAPPTDAPLPGLSDFDAAREAFYQGDYAAALASTNKALATLPNDPIIHEFRALVMFAQGKYPDAAAGLHSVLSVGPGWDWTTLSSLYPSVDIYTNQLRRLEDYLAKNPQADDARFVLAYHYLTAGNKDAAASQLQVLYKKTPQDNVIKELLLMVGGPEALGVATTPASPATAQAPAIAATDLVGNWSAKGQDNSQFTLGLTPDGSFTWTFSQNGKPQTVKGVYALDGNVLALEPESGGVMLAELTPPQAGSFQFQLLGAPPGDPGLKFAKAR
jgi:tetratricopeptide (TPR) repeat protein